MRTTRDGAYSAGDAGSSSAAIAPGKRTLTGQIQRKASTAASTPVVQRSAKDDVAAVKSKEIEAAQAQELSNWPGVAARARHRREEIADHLTGKPEAAIASTLTTMQPRWDGTPVQDGSFDPVNGPLDGKALRALLEADRADAAKLTGKKYENLVEWVTKLATALSAFLRLREKLGEEATEFHRFDDSFVDAEVVTLLAAVPGGFRPADLKAMLAQETGDFTDKSIAGLEGKSKGITHTMKANAGRVGIAQLDDDATDDARTLAARLGVTLPSKVAGKDARTDPAASIKIAAGYLAYIGAQLDRGLPEGRPSDALELRKLVMAAYNGGPFGLLDAARAVGGSYSWTKIAASPEAMSNFAKPGEVAAYVERVTARAP